jgi:cysteinyl-tRNA synthetase
MIEKHLAGNDKYAIDIHGGGADLLFPHHENEAAQTRCSSNHELANYWMHNGFVNIDGEKMSKSLGNSFFIKDALKVYDGEVLRFYLLSTHYRSNFNFNEQDLLASKKRLDKLYRLKKRLFGMNVSDEKTEMQSKLLEALSDDLIVSQGLIKRQTTADLAFIEKVLGFGLQNPFEYFQFGLDEITKTKIDALVDKRTEAKKAKDFEKSDALRDEIMAYGVSIMGAC